MQSKTENLPMITVYQADVGYLRKTLSHYALFEQIVGSIKSKFAGPMLKITTRIEVEDGATFTTSAQSLSKVLDLIGNMDVYSIIDVKMRLADECFDRWLEVPKKGAYKIAFPSGTYLFGCRNADGTQDEVGRVGSMHVLDDYRASNSVTHIYIPSTENKEIPIYPCEPFGVKKVDLGSWSQTVSAKPEVEVQSDPAKADSKAIATDLDAKRKAVTDLAREIQVSNLKASVRNPEVREALFKALRKDGDRETLTALFRLSREASFAIEWDELNRRKNHHA